MNQPVRVVSDQPYGSRQAMENAQRAVPLPNNQAVPPPAQSAASSPAGEPGPPALPGQNPFLRPTDRPMEPLTAGIPSGPGPGPEALSSVAPASDAVGDQLRAMYRIDPNNDVLRLIELHDHGY